MKRKLSILAVILTVALSVVRAASAQWVFMGVPGEGVSSLVVTGTTILAGTYYSSVYRSDDSGENWKELGSGLGPYPVVYSLCAIDTTFFAGTGEGVFRSTEHDTGWQLVSAKAMGDQPFAYALASSGSSLFAGTFNGAFFSTDLGNSWISWDSYMMGSVHAYTMAGGSMFAGSSGGIFILTNGMWTRVDSACGFGVSAFAVSGRNIFAGTDCSGILRSTDHGESWQSINNGLMDTAVETVVAFAVAGTNLFASTAPYFDGMPRKCDGLLISTDSGASWSNVSGDNMGALAVVGSYLFAGSEGVWRRPLSEMIGASAVAPTPSASFSINAYPNPFTDRATIRFSSPERGPADVRIVNIMGTEVARIFSGELGAGEHSFLWNGHGFAPGMYECLVKMGGRRVQFVPIVLR